MASHVYLVVVGFAMGSLLTLLLFQMSIVHEHRLSVVRSTEDSTHGDRHFQELQAQLQGVKDSLASTQHQLQVHELTQKPRDAWVAKRLRQMEADVQRVSSLQEELKEQKLLDAAGGCPSHLLADLSSREAMRKAGWRYVQMDNIHFISGQFLGWADGEEQGQIELRIPRAGKLILQLKNPHQATEPGNLVQLWLNEDLLASLKSLEDRQICITVEAGDSIVVSEYYGQIQIKKVELQCAPQDLDPTGIARRAVPADVGVRCTSDQQVWLPKGRLCHQGNSEWIPGEVDRVLNETRAIVRLFVTLEDLATSTTQYRLVSAHHLHLQPSTNASQHCASFEFTRQRVGIVLVADLVYQEHYANQILSQRCYAAWRGYDFFTLEPDAYVACRELRERFFFQKHCIIAEFLRERPNYTAVVIDADVVAAVLDRGVEEWTSVGADIHFYERVWCTEIAAGNYIARGTAWTIDFLMQWANYSAKLPKAFASEDNGAIHLHIVKSLQLEGSDECEELYYNITGDNKELDSYFRFVNCTKKLLGPPRLWHISGGAKLAFWGKVHFFVVDGVYLGKIASNFFGPVFHHGIKEPEVVNSTYYSNLAKCELNKLAVLRSREQYSEFIVYQAGWLSGHLASYGVKFPTGEPQPGSDCNPSDPFKPCLLPCMSTLSCPLLQNSDEPKPSRTCTDCM